MTDTMKAMLRELTCAHEIIQNALNLMTVDQQAAWAQANNAADLVDSGTTRFHERRKVILDAKAALVGAQHNEGGRQHEPG